jgi:hypothetical protein
MFHLRRNGAARAPLQSHARDKHRGCQAVDRGDDGLRRPALRGRISEPFTNRPWCEPQLPRRSRSEKYARKRASCAHPRDQGWPIPPPVRYHAAKTQLGHHILRLTCGPTFIGKELLAYPRRPATDLEDRNCAHDQAGCADMRTMVWPVRLSASAKASAMVALDTTSS